MLPIKFNREHYLNLYAEQGLLLLWAHFLPLSVPQPPPSSPPVRSNWLKPCCGRRAALWHVCLLSAGFNCFLVACVVLVVVLLTLELLIDIKLLQCECWKSRQAQNRLGWSTQWGSGLGDSVMRMWPVLLRLVLACSGTFEEGEKWTQQNCVLIAVQRLWVTASTWDLQYDKGVCFNRTLICTKTVI